jgi:integrase
MASITFFLKEPNLDRPTPIIARVAVGGRKVEVYTGLRIEPRRWIQAAQQAQTRGYALAGQLNTALAAQRIQLEAYLLTALAAGLVPTPEQLRRVLDPTPVDALVVPAPLPAAEVPADDTPAEPAALDLLAAYVAWDLAQADRRSPRTRQANTATLNHLRAFTAATGYPVDFGHINPVFANRFTSYLLATGRLTDNSVAKILTRLKAFLREAQAQGLTLPQDLRFLNWKRQEPGLVTLTAQELTKLEGLDLSGQPGQRNARDLFLLACYTGLRYSDLVSLRPEHWQGNLLRLRTQKTRETVTVPLRPGAQVLLQGLFAGELTFVSNQKLNAHLKRLGRQAGLLGIVERVRYAGGHRQVAQLRKYELLSCHTARRTFVTLALEAGLRPETVMKVTGHKDWSSFKRYVNIADSTIEREFAAVYGGGPATRPH